MVRNNDPTSKIRAANILNFIASSFCVFGAAYLTSAWDIFRLIVSTIVFNSLTVWLSS